MTPEDKFGLHKIAPHLASCKRVALLSPCQTEKQLFPGATQLTRRSWDLTQRHGQTYDLIVMSNILMYSQDPELWLSNLLASCKYLLLTEPVKRMRSAAQEMGPDGDQMRVTVSQSDQSVAAAPGVPVFDLSSLEDRLLGYSLYDGGDCHDTPSQHVQALVLGDAGQPLVRVDDYPTGVRPIEEDLTLLHQVLTTLESAKVPYTLGIVPALLDEPQIAFLRKLRFMVPAMHGYDHCYPHYSEKLKAAQDPRNQAGTVGAFNEFSGYGSQTIEDKLRKGRELLESALGKPVRAYIPPCNRCDIRTARALSRLGFTHAYSERSPWFNKLIWRKSDFYGRAKQYVASDAHRIVTLHATWEADELRANPNDTACVDFAQSIRLLANAARAAGQLLTGGFDHRS